jgi:hypothetical protein
VEQYLYFPSAPPWLDTGRTIPLPLSRMVNLTKVGSYVQKRRTNDAASPFEGYVKWLHYVTTILPYLGK